MLIDRLKIYVEGGRGGDGAVSFRREKYVPRGGPDGGDGGRGGNVYLVADPNLRSLFPLSHQIHYRAGRGAHGKGKKMHGASGKDLEVRVPLGTVVRPLDRPDVQVDLVVPGQRLLVARGGAGGRGNARFATPTNRAPRIAERGQPGERRWLLLELKLIADVGLVGLPNAGKSTLLAAVTAARPKIADYPFTTLSPNLGVVELEDETFVLADIPGLIEGAHAGAGLGHDFLRHIERTRLLIHLLDAAAEDPLRDFETIRRELELYQPELARRPTLVALNKMDLPEARARAPELRQALEARGYPTFPISAATGEGVRPLLRAALEQLRRLPPPFPTPEEAPTELALPPQRRGSRIPRVVREEDGAFRVIGGRAEAIVRRYRMDSWEAQLELERALEREGINDLLRQAGIRYGDTVRIGDLEWAWGEREEDREGTEA